MAVLELEHEVVDQDAVVPETFNIPVREVEVPCKPAHPVLLEMAELISRRGWCQGRYEDGRRLCIMGAFYEMLARDNTWMVDDAYEAPYYHGLHAFEKAIAPDMGAPDGEHWDAADWQDQPGRTKLEVVDRLRRVGMLGR